jgi:hypothetical protein
MKESNIIPILFDEDRIELMQIMFTVFHREWNDFKHAEPERADALYPALMSLIKEVSDKMHEQGWCKDPNCLEK